MPIDGDKARPSTPPPPQHTPRQASAAAGARPTAAGLQLGDACRNPVLVGDRVPARRRPRPAATNLTGVLLLFEQRQHLTGIAIGLPGKLSRPQAVSLGHSRDQHSRGHHVIAGLGHHATATSGRGLDRRDRLSKQLSPRSVEMGQIGVEISQPLIDVGDDVSDPHGPAAWKVLRQTRGRLTQPTFSAAPPEEERTACAPATSTRAGDGRRNPHCWSPAAASGARSRAPGQDPVRRTCQSECRRSPRTRDRRWCRR
jgi:hypothetical protein